MPSWRPLGTLPSSDFPTSYEQLKEVNKETGKSLLEEEFDRLTTFRTMGQTKGRPQEEHW